MSDAPAPDAPDPELEELRLLVTAVDAEIVAAVNRRLEVGARIRGLKAAKGLPFYDPERETRLVEELVRTNAGPLGDEGVRELALGILALAKREFERREQA